MSKDICIICGEDLVREPWDIYVCKTNSCKSPVKEASYTSKYGLYYDDEKWIWFSIGQMQLIVCNDKKSYNVTFFDSEGEFVSHILDNILHSPIEDFEQAAKLLKYFNF